MASRWFWFAVILFWTSVLYTCNSAEACTTFDDQDVIIINCKGCK